MNWHQLEKWRLDILASLVDGLSPWPPRTWGSSSSEGSQVKRKPLHIHKKLNKFMCKWFSCICFFQSGACSPWHIKASWKPYVWEVCSVCLLSLTSTLPPCNIHFLKPDLSFALCALSCLDCVYVCIYNLQRCRRQKIWESGRTTGGDFWALRELCFSHVIHTAIWLPHCWQSSCVCCAD